MTISDDRLTSPKYLAFFEKLLSRHYWTADDYDSIPVDLEVEIYDRWLCTLGTPDPAHTATTTDMSLAFAEALGDSRRVLSGVDVRVQRDIFRPDVVVLREPSEQRPTPGEMVHAVVEVIAIAGEGIERSAKRNAYAAQGIPLHIIADGKPGRRFAEVYRLQHDEYEVDARVPPDARIELREPFPFVLDMKQINS